LHDGRLFQTGGQTKIYDPASGAWSPAAPMRERRDGHTATLLPDGRVLIAGGGTRSLEIYDPGRDAWAPVSGQLSEIRSHHAAALLDTGLVLLCGGWDGVEALNSADLFDPATGDVHPAGFLTVPRFDHTATKLLDGNVLIAGGRGLTSMEVYDPEQQSFTPAGNLIRQLSGHIAVLLPDNNEVLFADRSSTEIYTPWTGQTRMAPPVGKGETFQFPTLEFRQNATVPTVAGAGWQPGERVRIAAEPEVEATADNDGKFVQELPTNERPPFYVTARARSWEARIGAKADTTISFNDFDASLIYGGATKATISVTGGAFTPAGTVTIYCNSSPFASGTLTSGTISFTLALPPGTDTITAGYSGDAFHNPSTTQSSYAVQIAQDGPSVKVFSSPNPAVYGQPLSLTGSVTWSGSGTMVGLAPTGTVYFYADGPTIATGTLLNGVATASPAPVFDVGTYFLSNLYAGDTNYLPVASTDAIVQVVNQASSAVNLSVTPNPAYYGQQVTVRYTFTAVAPSLAVLSGSCTLTIDGSNAGCGPLANGAGSNVYGNGLAVGSRTIAVTYPGNSNISGISGSTTLTVNKDTPTVKLISSANPSVARQSITFTASVVPTNIALVTTGMVAFADGSNPLGSVTLNANGIATLATSALAAGSHTITAAYSGDGNFNANSGSLVQSVGAASAPCDLNGDGSINVQDMQRIITEVLGAFPLSDDLNGDGRINVVDIQIESNAILGKGCAS